MSKAKLISAIETVNKRYAMGKNDDDQVARMIEIANKTKGFYFMPEYDSYSLCTDEELLFSFCTKYGYWSEQVKRFNEVLTNKGGHDYMVLLNNKAKEYLKTI
jgi:hypothetical protein